MEESDYESQVEEHLSSLKRSAKVAEDSITTALNRLKLAQHNLNIELKELSQTELRSKPGLRAWLKARELPLDCSFQEFFQKFLEEHKQEYRLNLSDRSICLNKDGCKLFGLEGSNVKLGMPEVLERLPLLYH
jgi:hypothetical protein